MPSANVDFDEDHFWIVPKLHPELPLVSSRIHPEQNQRGRKRSIDECNPCQVDQPCSLPADIEDMCEATTDPYLVSDEVHVEESPPVQTCQVQPLKLKFVCSNLCGGFFEWTQDGEGPCAISHGDHFRFQPVDTWITGLHPRESVSSPCCAVASQTPKRSQSWTFSALGLAVSLRGNSTPSGKPSWELLYRSKQIIARPLWLTILM